MAALFRHLDRIRSDKKQRTSLAFLLIFSMGVLVLMFLQMRNQIYAPFAYHGAVPTTTTISLSETNADYLSFLGNPVSISKLSSDQVLKLRTTDTDGDGLSDYDEIYVYKTSPFLEDSDSDGFSDKQEVANGTDPNCPQGQICKETNFSTATATTSDIITNLSDSLNSVDSSVSSSSTLNDQIMQGVLSGNADPAVLRKVLIDNGISKTDLDNVSDQDLLKSYAETLNNMSSQDQTNAQ